PRGWLVPRPATGGLRRQRLRRPQRVGPTAQQRGLDQPGASTRGTVRAATSTEQALRPPAQEGGAAARSEGLGRGSQDALARGQVRAVWAAHHVAGEGAAGAVLHGG